MPPRAWGYTSSRRPRSGRQLPWAPNCQFVGAGTLVVRKDRLDHRPGGLNRVFTGEERAVASHGVGQEPLVGRFLARLFFEQVEFSLVADEVLPCVA